MAIRTRRVICAGVLALLLAACQPVDRLDLDEEVADVSAPVPADTGVPGSLEALLARGAELAREWERDPVLAEVAVGLDEVGWQHARLLYLAADSDRFLSLRFEGGRVSRQQVTLETLGLEPVPAQGTDGVPTFPGDALEPGDLVEVAAPHLSGCLEGAPTEVIYDTGAPAAWDGRAWADPPLWTALIWRSGGEGGGQGARVDPASGEPTLDDYCVTVGDR